MCALVTHDGTAVGCMKGGSHEGVLKHFKSGVWDELEELHEQISFAHKESSKIPLHMSSLCVCLWLPPLYHFLEDLIYLKQ